MLPWMQIEDATSAEKEVELGVKMLVSEKRTLPAAALNKVLEVCKRC